MKERSVGIRELQSKLSECVREVKSAGTLPWSGRRLGATKPDIRPRGKRTVAEILVENRG